MLLDMTDRGPRHRSNWEFVNQPGDNPESPPAARRNPVPAVLTSQVFKKKTLPALVILVALVLAGGGYAYFKPSHPKQGKPGAYGQQISQQVSIPLYYPQNLPGGYSYNNDAKVIKANVLYISVTGPGQQSFYITQQAVPASFDFVAFNKKFLNPDSFSADSGTVTAGQVGANLIGSVRTDKNTWIIINAPSTSSLTEMETVIRSFELVK